MLSELRIAALGVIDEAVLEPGVGFTAVTGETGAGKTLVVTGLGLLLGARAPARIIRHGEAKAVVEGRFTVDETLAGRVDDLGGDLEDGELLVTRHVTPNRSRSFLGGAAVPVTACADLIGDMVTIHGQSEQVRLATPERQREILDRFAGPEFAAELAVYSEGFLAWREARAELVELTSQASARARERDVLIFGLTEIEKVDPQPDEDTKLAAEAHRLQAVDDLRLSARRALVAVAGDDEAGDDLPNVLALLATAKRAAAATADRDPSAVELAQGLTEASYLVADLAARLAAYLADLEADPLRLEWIAGRRAELQGLTRKYGATCHDVLAWAQEAARRVTHLAASDDRIELLRAQVENLEGELRLRAAHLNELRRASAAALAEHVRTELAALAMPTARLEFVVEPGEKLGLHGTDTVTLLFSANPGSAPAPLGRVASGGELSRVRLALEVVLAAGDQGHTFVFDEVDAGVGGAVALEIGRRLSRLARRAQVIVVTHLAQVAAFADRHFVVSKASDGQVTSSGIAEVTGDRRIAELARMMAGLESADSARAHALDLLKVAGRG